MSGTESTGDTRQTGVPACRATAPNIWPPKRCMFLSGHGGAHQTADGVYWLGPEPPAETVLLSGGPFSGERIAEGATPRRNVLILLPDDDSRAARYGQTADPHVYVFCGFDPVVRTGGEA